MDSITHGIAGAVIAKAGFSKRLGRSGIIAGVIVSLVPDADLILRLFGDEVFLKYHRGFGNSLFLIPPVALGLAFVFNRLSSKKNFPLFFVLCLLEVTVHTFLDLQTSFGTMLLFPFSDRRFSHCTSWKGDEPDQGHRKMCERFLTLSIHPAVQVRTLF